MLRVFGLWPIPRATLGYLTVAIVCLVLGFVINLVGAVTGWSGLLWVSVPMLGVGAVCAVLAIRTAATG
jgi:uncharacterized membrane protein